MNEEWEKLQILVERDIENQIRDHFEDRAAINRWRARNGLPILRSF